MNETAVIRRRDALVEGEIDGELVGVDVDRGLCFGFNATATRLWRMLESPQTLGQLVDAFLRTHEVDRETCMRDVAAAVEALRGQSLVTVTFAA